MATEVSFVPAEVNLTVYDGDSLNVQFNLIYNNGDAWVIPTLGGGAGWKGDIRDSSTALTSLSSYQAANSTTIVYTSPTTHYLQVGDSVTITSSSVSSHNLTANITAVTSTTFSVTGTTTTPALNGTGGQFVGKILGSSGTNSGTLTLTPSTSSVAAYLEPSTSALLKPGTLYNYDVQYSYVLSSKTYLKTIVYGTITVESQATL